VNLSDPTDAHKFVAQVVSEYANTLQPSARFSLTLAANVALQTLSKPAAVPPPAPVVDVPSD
jgi:hypothetical protein